MILGKMKEAQENEVSIEDLDAETLAIMISFIYTGNFDVGDNLDIQMVARAADKYDLKGFIKLLCFKMKNSSLPGDDLTPPRYPAGWQVQVDTGREKRCPTPPECRRCNQLPVLRCQLHIRQLLRQRLRQ